MIKIKYGDSFELIEALADNSVDLVITSPPYADTVSYGAKVNVFHPNNYADWIIPLIVEIQRVLKPTGSFVLNINDKVVNKERSIYVYDLVCRIVRETKLVFYDRYIWGKLSGLPSGGDKRLNDKIEYLFHFVKDKNKFKCYTDRIRVPYAKSSVGRVKTPVGGNKTITKDGIAEENLKKIELNALGTKPTTLLNFPTSGTIKWKKKLGKKLLHPAAFHPNLPKWFITWLTDENDLVLDPFIGSGTTAVACQDLKRNCMGFELNENYKEIIDLRLKYSA